MRFVTFCGTSRTPCVRISNISTMITKAMSMVFFFKALFNAPLFVFIL